jgi:hypothetical protein
VAAALFWKALSPVDVVFAGVAGMETQIMTLATIRAGKAVTLLWNLVQSVPPPAAPYTPAAAPLITIIDANGVMQVNAQAMTSVAGRLGVYSYEYVTPSGGALGAWSAWVDVIDPAGNPAGSSYQAGQAKATPVFQLV